MLYEVITHAAVGRGDGYAILTFGLQQQSALVLAIPHIGHGADRLSQFKGQEGRIRDRRQILVYGQLHLIQTLIRITSYNVCYTKLLR